LTSGQTCRKIAKHWMDGVDMQWLSRRQFLKAVGSVAVGLPLIFQGNRAAHENGCPVCTAIVVGGHFYTAGEQSGTYCPNCGIETTGYHFDLDRKLSRIFPAEASHQRRNPALIWDCAQVPFPNRHLLHRTNKPAVLLSDVQLGGAVAG
jgi:hypothetical protein